MPADEMPSLTTRGGPQEARPRGGKRFVEIDRNGLEVLDREECLRLLATATLGRLAITAGALPVVLPVNFCLVGDRILFRTVAGSRLDAATRDAVVAFEVDDIERRSGTGWSVMVTGVAGPAADLVRLAELAGADIPRWAPFGRERIIEVTTEMISGRRFASAPR